MDTMDQREALSIVSNHVRNARLHLSEWEEDSQRRSQHIEVAAEHLRRALAVMTEAAANEALS